MNRLIGVLLLCNLAGVVICGVGTGQVFAGSHDEFVELVELVEFDLRAYFDGNTITFEPADSGNWSTTMGLSPENPGPLIVTEAGLGSLLKDLEADEYCFSVELVEGRIVMQSVRGTTWTTLSYGCGQESSCGFLVSERGVNARR